MTLWSWLPVINLTPPAIVLEGYGSFESFLYKTGAIFRFIYKNWNFSKIKLLTLPFATFILSLMFVDAQVYFLRYD